MKRSTPHLKKRAYERVPSSLEFHSLNVNYFGVVTDLSENGMFIMSQKISFPFELNFVIKIPLEEDIISVPVKVARVTKSKKFYDGMGVKLLKTSKNYLELVRKLRFADKFQKNPLL